MATRNVCQFSYSVLFSLDVLNFIKSPAAYLLTSHSRVGVADDIRGPTKCMNILEDGL